MTMNEIKYAVFSGNWQPGVAKYNWVNWQWVESQTITNTDIPGRTAHIQRRITNYSIVFQINKYVNLACFLNICKHIMVFLCFSRVKILHTAPLIIGPKTPTSNNLEHCLTLDGCSVNSSSSVRNLGVLFNSNLSFDSHVSSICKTAFFHLKNISKLRPMLSMSNAETLIHAFMTSRLDYCNALLGGCSARLINKLQMVQNAAARVLTRTRKY